jgi:NitT/TauT family transport system ATP-binding protein
MEAIVLNRTQDMTSRGAPLVSAKNVCQVYDKGTAGSLVVLDNVNVELHAGEIVGLLGRSGSGKSTLLRAIAGLIRPSQGAITFDGKPIVGTSSEIAVVFQNFALFPWLTVMQNVELGLEAQGVAYDERRKRALAAIDLIGLDGFENAYPKELSGGMRQRVGLARALVVHPQVLLMDEPFSALDVLTAETLRTDLLDLWCDGKMPIQSMLMVTHNIEEAVLMCDRILIFGSNPGRVIAEIKVDLPQPRNRLDPGFRRLVEDIYARMTLKANILAKDGTLAATGIAMALPNVSTNLMSGLIETVAAEPYLGQADLPPLAADLRLDINELFPVAETLQLLRFADLEGGDIKLTAAGLRFYDSDVDERKHLFEQHLAKYVPLAAHIRRILDERPSHRAPAGRFRDELEDHMSEDYAAVTLRAVTNWARYAEYFAYDDNGDLFTLENPI